MASKRTSRTIRIKHFFFLSTPEQVATFERTGLIFFFSHIYNITQVAFLHIFYILSSYSVSLYSRSQPEFACTYLHTHTHEVAHMFVQACTWGSQGVRAFSCLFVFQRWEPQQVTEVKPQLSDSFVNGGGLGSGVSRGGVKRGREWMMEGGRQGERERGGLCKTIPLTLGHSQTQEMLDLTPWEMSTADHLC